MRGLAATSGSRLARRRRNRATSSEGRDRAIGMAGRRGQTATAKARPEPGHADRCVRRWRQTTRARRELRLRVPHAGWTPRATELRHQGVPRRHPGLSDRLMAERGGSRARSTGEGGARPRADARAADPGRRGESGATRPASGLRGARLRRPHRPDAPLLQRADAAWVLYKLDQGIDQCWWTRRRIRANAMEHPAADRRGFHRRRGLATACARSSRWAIPSSRSSRSRALTPPPSSARAGISETRIDTSRAASDGRFVFHDEKLSAFISVCAGCPGGRGQGLRGRRQFRGLWFEEPGGIRPSSEPRTPARARGAPGLVENREFERPGGRSESRRLGEAWFDEPAGARRFPYAPRTETATLNRVAGESPATRRADGDLAGS